MDKKNPNIIDEKIAAQRARRREYDRKYREANREKIVAYHAEYGKNYYAKRKDEYRKRRDDIRKITARAEIICPTFRFLCNVRAQSLLAYTSAYKPQEDVIPEVAKSCDALRIMDNRICPLIRKQDITSAEIESKCPMRGAFKIYGAANQIKKIVKQLQGQCRG